MEATSVVSFYFIYVIVILMITLPSQLQIQSHRRMQNKDYPDTHLNQLAGQGFVWSIFDLNFSIHMFALVFYELADETAFYLAFYTAAAFQMGDSETDWRLLWEIWKSEEVFPIFPIVCVCRIMKSVDWCQAGYNWNLGWNAKDQNQSFPASCFPCD